MKKILDADDVRSRMSNGKVTLQLTQGQAAWNPASTTSLIYGPALLVYTFHADGGVDVRTMRL